MISREHAPARLMLKRYPMQTRALRILAALLLVPSGSPAWAAPERPAENRAKRLLKAIHWASKESIAPPPGNAAGKAAVEPVQAKSSTTPSKRKAQSPRKVVRSKTSRG